MSLEALRQALAGPLAAHPEVKVGTLPTPEVEFLTLEVEPAHGACHYLRIAVAAHDPTLFVMRWSLYHVPAQTEDTDGSTLGDLQFALSTIQHWIFERRRYADVPEFQVESMQAALDRRVDKPGAP